MIIELIAQCTRIFHPPGIERLLRFFYHPDRRQHDSIETVIPYDHDLKIHVNTASFIEWFIFFKGSYEPDIVTIVKRNLKAGDVFVDVGANVGVHTLIASKCVGKTGRVIAIEPIPFIVKRLEENISLNNILNVCVVERAISDKEGMTDIYLPNETMGNMGTSSIYKERVSNEKHITVPTTTLDILLKDEPRVDFLKIDIEGGDTALLAGTKDIFVRFHPRVIIETEGFAALDFLRQYGYNITQVGTHEYFAE